MGFFPVFLGTWWCKLQVHRLIQPLPPTRSLGEGCLTECPEEAGADSQASPVEAMLKIGISLILLNVVMLAFIAGPKWHQDCPGKIGMGSFRIILWAW